MRVNREISLESLSLDHRLNRRLTLILNLFSIVPMQNVSERLIYLFACLCLPGLFAGCTRNVFNNPTPPAPAVVAAPAIIEQNTTVRPTPESPAKVPEIATQPEPNDIWQRIRNGYRFTDIDNAHVNAAIHWFTSNESVIRKSSDRATPLIHHIVDKLDNSQLPMELALIPLLETGYRVHSRSPYGALGPWQFMPATGRQYGLQRTAYLDQRRDIALSTQAALSYLTDLHGQFKGDWLLAIAAYNAGPGTIKKALRGQRLSFWDIVDKLPKETQTYVPKLLAAARIIGNPRAYGTTLKSIPDKRFFETIEVQGPVDFDVLDSIEQWDKKTFRRLNGALSSSYYGRTNKLAIQVPVGSGNRISNHLLAAGPPPARESFQYRVKRGDTLGALAIRFNVPIKDIRRYNGIHGNNIRAGKSITIPSSSSTLRTSSETSARGSHQHIVKPGDSFWTLGRRYGISARSLASHNGHAINKTLYPGQTLTVPPANSPSKLDESLSRLNYVVERGDSLWSIAKRFGVATADLKRWNPLVNSKLLRPGQKLLLQTP